MLAGALRHGSWVLTVDSTITILIGLADHLINLIIGQLLTNGGHDVAELGSRDEAIVIAVEDLESFSDFFLGIRVLHLSRHHGKEL